MASVETVVVVVDLVAGGQLGVDAVESAGGLVCSVDLGFE